MDNDDDPVLAQMGFPYLDLASEEYKNDPIGHIEAMRGAAQFATSSRGLEVLSYSVMEDMLRDSRRLPHVAPSPADDAPASIRAFEESGLLVVMEGEQHQRLRTVLVPGFTRARVESVRPMVRSIANGLIDSFIDGAEFDAVGDYSHHLSINAVSRFIGVPPEDVHLFDDLTTTFHLPRHGATSARVDDAFRELSEYVTGLVNRRTSNPQNDFVSWLTDAHTSDGKLSSEELVWSIANILMAGHETTRWSIASAVLACAEHDGVFAAIQDDEDLLREFVDEVIRFYPAVVALPVRKATEDMVHGGVAIPKDTVVSLNTLGAARDPQKFSDPGRFDIRRGPYPVAFGLGPHLCLGHLLARLEIEEAVRALARRMSTLAVAGPIAYTADFGLLRGPEMLPIRFTRR